jgi:hypothetical protein
LDKLDLIAAATIAEFRKGGFLTPAGCLQQLRESVAIANKVLREDQESRDELNALSLDLKLSNLDISIANSEITLNIQVVSSTIMMPVDVQGSTIMMPVDVQGSYIMMPVDIQAQYITLKVDIVAQSVTLNVNISASAVTLNINIASSAITLTVTASQLSIKIDAQTVGIYGERDWAAYEDYDLLLTGSVNISGTSWGTVISYTVPSNKVLYINDVVYSGKIADGVAQVTRSSTVLWQVEWDETDPPSPMFWEFPTPIKFTAGQVVKLYVRNEDTTTKSARGNLGCRLVPA